METISELKEVIKDQQKQINELEKDIQNLINYFAETEIANESIIADNPELETRPNKLFSRYVERFVEANTGQSKIKVAKAMKISQGRLYELINGKRQLTDLHLQAAQLAMGLTEDEFISLKELCESERKKKKMLKKAMVDRINKLLTEKKNVLPKLNTASKSYINSWLHFAVLSVFKLDNFVATREWIAAKLNVTEEELGPVIDSLIDMKALSENDGVLEYKFHNGAISYSDSDDSKEKVRNIDLGQIEKAVAKYNELNLPYENTGKAGFGGFYFAGDSAKLKQANKMYIDSCIKISNYLSSDKKDKIYSFTYQLCPLT
jgi:transcriptional regulator with XRE-family HTH domain/uncharacterized coiled-coil protein SlyX